MSIVCLSLSISFGYGKSNYVHRDPFLSFDFKNKNISLTNVVEFVAYYRNAILFEITGNEQTFGVYLNNYLTFNYDLNSKIRFSLFWDGDFYQPISDKSRNYNSLNAPILRTKKASIGIQFNNEHYFKIGIMPPIIYNFPMASYFPPTVFRLSVTNDQSSNVEHTLVLGERDLPIMYLGLVPRHDTGILYEWIHPSGFMGKVGIFNGEEGLDANSAKHFVGKIGFTNRHLETAIVASVGNIGSIPIKETRHIYKFYLYGGGNLSKGGTWKLGVDSLFSLHSIRDADEPPSNQTIAGQFFYGPNYYSPFSLPRLPGRDDLYGLSAHLFIQFHDLFFNRRLFIDSHVGFYDPDVLVEQDDSLDNDYLYQIKYRAFLRIMVRLIDELYLVISDTYTYDPVFFNASQQFWQREDPDTHIRLDMDIFIGLRFRI